MRVSIAGLDKKASEQERVNYNLLFSLQEVKS